MNGRLEGELKKKEKTDKLLSEMPDYVSKWVLVMRASNKTESSIQDYVQKIGKFMRFINADVVNITTDMITPDIVCEYFISLQTKEKNGNIVETSDSYKITNWCCLNNFLGFLTRRGYIPYNYMDDITKPKNNDLVRINEHRIQLTQENFNSMIKAVKYGAGTHRARARQREWRERDMAVLLLFMTTGIRETALSQINIEDIDFDNNILLVRDKGDKQHKYILKEQTKTAIINWLNKREKLLANKDTDTNALFISNKGTRLAASGASELVQKYSIAGMGYKIRPHKLRAGFCTILYNINPDILFVSDAVGHSSINTTRRYIVTGNSGKEKAANIMDSLITI